MYCSILYQDSVSKLSINKVNEHPYLYANAFTPTTEQKQAFYEKNLRDLIQRQMHYIPALATQTISRKLANSVQTNYT